MVGCENIITISNLFVSYSGHPVIKDFSFSMKKGEKVIISGPNGCGKTTLLKCICGILKPDKGQILLASDNIAYLKQDFSGSDFPISSEEVVKMGLFKNKSGSERDVVNAMQKTETLHLSDRAFHSLSGGEKQRVSLARCFCQKADFLLFDEPSSFLDESSFTSFTDVLKTLDREISAIVVTHNADFSRLPGWKTVELKGCCFNE